MATTSVYLGSPQKSSTSRIIRWRESQGKDDYNADIKHHKFTKHRVKRGQLQLAGSLSNENLLSDSQTRKKKREKLNVDIFVAAVPVFFVSGVQILTGLVVLEGDGANRLERVHFQAQNLISFSFI